MAKELNDSDNLIVLIALKKLRKEWADTPDANLEGIGHMLENKYWTIRRCDEIAEKLNEDRFVPFSMVDEE